MAQGRLETYRWRALGHRVFELRTAAGLTQAEAGERVGQSESYFGGVEIGRRRPRPEILRTIADILAADYDELAILAGYLPPQADRPIFARTETQANWLRRLRRFPDRILGQLDRIGEALLDDEPDDGDGADLQSRDETEDQSDPDEPPADAGAGAGA